MHTEAVDALRTNITDDAIDGNGRVPHGSSDDPDVLDFSTNVNPCVPEQAVEIYRQAFDDARHYPADGYAAFRAAAADYVDSDPSQVIPMAGGLAALRLAIQTHLEPGDSVLVPRPSFGEYAREIRLQGSDPVFVPHDSVLDEDPDDHAMAIVCNPNNPTGEAYSSDALREFSDRCCDAGTTLLVDEAFLGFTDHPSVAGRDGVIVARSLTKLFGLPGLRTGFAVATGTQRERLETGRMPWSLGTPEAMTGAYCMSRSSFITDTRRRVELERERMRERLVGRFPVTQSDAPFLLLECRSSNAVDDLLARVDDHDIAVRDARSFRGLDAHVRIAVRRPDENDRLLGALDV